MAKLKIGQGVRQTLTYSETGTQDFWVWNNKAWRTYDDGDLPCAFLELRFKSGQKIVVDPVGGEVYEYDETPIIPCKDGLSDFFDVNGVQWTIQTMTHKGGIIYTISPSRQNQGVTESSVAATKSEAARKARLIRNTGKHVGDMVMW